MNKMEQDVKAEKSAEGASGKDDVWIPSTCNLCYATCSMLAHRVDGVVVKIEGNPESTVGKGRLCGKGISGIMTHYDPNRVRTPLRRTNPEKGIDVDPKWEEISWDEALGEIAQRLKRIRDDDPRKLIIYRTTTVYTMGLPWSAFAPAFGSTTMAEAGGGLHCGNSAHQVSGMMHSSWGILPDFQYCNYAMYFGASKGHSAGHAANSNMAMAADARVRGMKLVVVDPMCNFAASKATEWVPIRVGTDAGLALSMCNVLVNELGAIDAPYLKAKTNASYLVGPNGTYARDPETNDPLVWDLKAGEAKPYNVADSEDMALEGSYDVQGVTCQPGFVLLKEHLKKFTPEKGEEISTVPAADIRRLATTFAEEARIGSTIVIDGVTLPYRPAAAIAFRGVQGHRNATFNFLAVDLLNQLVGAADVVGSCLGFNPSFNGIPETGRMGYAPKAGPDGLLEVGTWMAYDPPYPRPEPKKPTELGMQDLFVMGMTSPFLNAPVGEELWDKFEVPYRPEMIMNYGTNMIMSIANKDVVAESLKKIDYMVSFDLFLTETSVFADIVLPDRGYLGCYNTRPNIPFIFSHPAGMGDWSWSIQQPIVEPEGNERSFADVLAELAERAGFLADYNAAFNAILDLRGDYRLDMQRKYDYAEICDADLKNNFGDDRGLEWFKEKGVAKWPKTPEEVYWRPFNDARVPIYWEWMPALRDKIQALTEPHGLDIPEEFYSALVDWLPCVSHECEEEGFDFYSFYYRDTLHTNSFTMENPWLDEAARLDPFSYNIVINADTGAAKGLVDGDMVWVENQKGRKVKGKVRLTETIHPEGLGVAALCGHWSDGLPVAKGKGVFYNELLELDWENINPVNLTIDLCAKVKVTRAEA
ncbi:MAG: molybdopterin-dependent oxidoreductase [Rhodospirillales bacterium]|jgi:molybdopterin-containing oxidoreductase family molybdopterin binding subunit|nr:molybdopterin-dependent oxidoreductase [Rhodospirillales bacterium]